METVYRFRELTEDDRPGILDIARQLGYAASEQTVSDLVDLVLKKENQQMVIADNGKHLLGYIHLIFNDTNESAVCVDIAGILIPDDFRGKGIGTAFIKEAEKWSRGRDVKTMNIRRNLIRNEAIPFFNHHGFKTDLSGEILTKELI
jgi:GNAT superfamily N-acetyltransferase